MKDFSISSKYDIKLRGKYTIFPTIAEEKASIKHNILLIHAFPFDSEMYYANFSESKLVQALDELGIQYGNIRIILPDLPGFGRSESFMDQPHDLTPYVDIIREVIDFFEIQTLILGGCSMGGYITLEYLRTFPNSVNGLILIDTKSTPDDEEQKQNRYKSMEILRSSLKKWGKLKKNSKMEKVHETIHEIRDYIGNLHAKVLSQETISTNLDLSENIFSIMKRQNPLAIIHALGAMAGRIDNSEPLRRFKKSILIVIGEKDVLIPIEIAQQMHSTIPHSVLKIIPHAGHLSNAENVANFNQIFINWVKDVISI